MNIDRQPRTRHSEQEQQALTQYGEHRPIDVLIVDDNPGDIRLAQEALRESPDLCQLHAVNSGQAALQWLHREHPYGTAVRPHLVVLDLHLPGIDGHQVLSVVKANDDLKMTPIVVFSASPSDQDFATCYRLQANCCVTKPNDVDEYLRTIHAIVQFWATVARIPAVSD